MAHPCCAFVLFYHRPTSKLHSAGLKSRVLCKAGRWWHYFRINSLWLIPRKHVAPTFCLALVRCLPFSLHKFSLPKSVKKSAKKGKKTSIPHHQEMLQAQTIFHESVSSSHRHLGLDGKIHADGARMSASTDDHLGDGIACTRSSALSFFDNIIWAQNTIKHARTRAPQQPSASLSNVLGGSSY